MYTNHCICGTTATAMYKSGYSLHDIAQVTKHKNLESLKFYLEQSTIEDMENYSDSLFKYAGANDENKNNNNTNNSDDEFETPPVKTHNVYADVTVQNEEKSVVPYSTTSTECKKFSDSNHATR